MNLNPAFRIGRRMGVSWFGWRYWLPAFERSPGFWTLHLLGWCLWYDALPPQSVGERGAW